MHVSIDPDARDKWGIPSARLTLAHHPHDLTVVEALQALAMAVWATVDLIGARAGYTRATLFHFDLELAVVALIFVERRRPGAR